MAWLNGWGSYGVTCGLTRSRSRSRGRRRNLMSPDPRRVCSHSRKLAALRSDSAELDEDRAIISKSAADDCDLIFRRFSTYSPSTSSELHEKDEKRDLVLKKVADVQFGNLQSRSIELHEKDEEGDLILKSQSSEPAEPGGMLYAPRTADAIHVLPALDEAWCAELEHNALFDLGLTEADLALTCAPGEHVNLGATLSSQSQRHASFKEMCSICLERLHSESNACEPGAVHRSETQTLPCEHEFHLDCVVRWLTISPICPICRADYAMQFDTALTA